MTKIERKLDFALHLDFSAILTNPILDIAAHVWEDDRYDAFKVCYRSMRLIDDLVDDRKSEGSPLTDIEITMISDQMNQWVSSIKSGSVNDEFGKIFLKTLHQFDIPLWPWERLCNAMIYDLQHDGFPSFLSFTRYTEGAAIAPAAIFMHLCGLQRDGNSYKQPVFDIRQAARSLALFSYLVHIMRDFEKDQRNNLQYYADTIITKHNLNRSELKKIAENGKPSGPFRSLMKEYCHIAEFYRNQARGKIDSILPYLEPRYQLSLEMIYGLYLQIYERIDPINGQFSGIALNPTPGEVQLRIEQIIEHFVPEAECR
jgi:phytoene/squalene synthetase